MIDGAAFSFEENIAFTQEAVDFCKSYGVPVEAELGAILGKEDDHVSEADCKTEPEKVKTFVERTGCDMLAVSIGNVHRLDDIPRSISPAEAHCRSQPGAAGYPRRLRYRPGDITQFR